MGQTLTAMQVSKGGGGKYEVSLLQPQEVEHYWSMIVEELERIPHLWVERYTLGGMLGRVLEGSIQVWVVGTEEKWTMVAFTQKLLYEVSASLNVMLVFGGGATKEMFELLTAAFERFCGIQECSRIECVVRPGMEPLLYDLGGRRVGVSMVKQIYNMRMQ